MINTENLSKDDNKYDPTKAPTVTENDNTNKPEL